MLQESWKRPALQKSEAVLLPALHRMAVEPNFSDRYASAGGRAAGFVPPWDSADGRGPQTTALSTYVRPRGSMAGRGILKAAGVNLDPYAQRTRARRGLAQAARPEQRSRMLHHLAKRFPI